jgi:hypothetical protein
MEHPFGKRARGCGERFIGSYSATGGIDTVARVGVFTPSGSAYVECDRPGTGAAGGQLESKVGADLKWSG